MAVGCVTKPTKEDLLKVCDCTLSNIDLNTTRDFGVYESITVSTSDYVTLTTTIEITTLLSPDDPRITRLNKGTI